MKMSKITVSDAQAFCLSRKIAFYSYRLPGRKDCCFGTQLEGEVQTGAGIKLTGKGFLSVPFRETEEVPSFFIRGDFCFCKETEDGEGIKSLYNLVGREEETTGNTFSDSSREEYRRQLKQMIAVLQAGKMKKMVLSRSLSFSCPAYSKAPEWFERLCAAYPEAFVFLVMLPGKMTWMGATPEVFLRQTGQKAETMALAGTRKAGSDGEWGEKEKEEQEIVSRYIAQLLPEREKWKIEGPFTHQAAQVEHLCTLFQYPGLLPVEERESLRQALHPTPAVGGYPAGEAIRLIEQIEGRKRRYYAGYIGPCEEDGCFDWFVNLRSMELWPHRVRLYVGGGITALSDPEKEWEETELKSRTLLEIVENREY